MAISPLEQGLGVFAVLNRHAQRLGLFLLLHAWTTTATTTNTPILAMHVRGIIVQ